MAGSRSACRAADQRAAEDLPDWDFGIHERSPTTDIGTKSEAHGVAFRAGSSTRRMLKRRRLQPMKARRGWMALAK